MEVIRLKKIYKLAIFLVLGAFILTGCGTQSATSQPAAPAPAATAATDDLKKQIDEVKGALPKFAIPMREVGDRFDNMYVAAKGGNWALAKYMSSYMFKSMGAAKVTKPNEYPAWESFYKGAFDPVNKAIDAKDFAAFDKAYTGVIDSCNGCHASMGYKYIKIVKKETGADFHADYNLKTEPTEFK